MKTKTILLPGLAIASGLALAGWIIFKQTAPQETARTSTERLVARAELNNPTSPAVMPATTPDSSPAEQITKHSDSAPHPAKSNTAQKVATQSNPIKKPKEPLQDPDARVALGLVGADPDAEQYWIAAINDSRLSAHERQDLIEDLNEDGLSDPRNPGLEDLPLIVSRLQIIEELAPDAMDTVNAEAFREAYKDLANMYGRLTQR